MVKVAFIGLGRVGSLALKLFAKHFGINKVDEVLAIDVNPERKGLADDVGAKFVLAMAMEDLVSVSKDSHIAVVALPSSIAFNVVKELLKSGINVVDVSYIKEDPYSLQDITKSNNVFYIPHAGFAPGLSNVVAGYAYEVLGELDYLRIYVGGIPIKPVPPIGYEITWSAEDLLEEYTRPVKIVLNGEVVEKDPLSKIIDVEIEGVGKFEGFFSDGLTTLIRNVKAKEMFEVTLRWPGHLGFMKVLRDLGFMSDEPLVVDYVPIKPKRFTARILEKSLRRRTKDWAILEVKVGSKKGSYRFLAVLKGTDEYPATTLFTALILEKTVEIALTNEIPKGVMPLERFTKYLDTYIDRLKEYGCLVRQHLIPSN
ncbi:MAG TPA: hypothetical protein ENF75_05130 [Acidilobales archaeon]|nr:MAG: hypothetical protein B6U85_05680 [Desulfurococcales archaeon ex4484_42]HDD26454.1 hypothetical protein [Acidilobales archaeon]